MRVHFKKAAVNISVMLPLLIALAGCAKEEKAAALEHLKVSVCDEGLGVFRTEGEWNEFWAKHKVHGKGAAVPKVDFGRFTAILASTGRTNAGAADVKITGIVKHGENMVEALIHNEQAGENCAVTRAVVCPTDVILIPKGSYSVRFTEELRVVNCQDY